MKKCLLLGCDKLTEDNKTYCTPKHGHIDNHRYTGETLQEYTKRKADKKKK